ncbi:MAG: MCE family protein [Epsilonproteobacteria bacterium]|nr:MCE family protein [Campylobacterota bacterium]
MNLETRVGAFILVAIGVFLYLSINIRSFRLDKDQYYSYRAYFEDTGGLTSKAPVKIAGVEVGWVDRIDLLSDGKAEVILRISKNIKLAKNAYAMIHQDGLIGTKNLEIDPGDSSTGFLLPGSMLSMPGRTPASWGELLDQVRDIASTVQDITSSFKNTFATQRGEGQMQGALDAVAKATDRIADFSLVMQRTMKNNEENINVIASDLRSSVASLKDSIPQVTDAVQKGADKFGDAADGAKQTFNGATEVVEKINSGKGVVGKLINEDETYGDLKKTIRGFRDYVGKQTGLMLNIDMHGESFLRHNNSKGYFELRLRPNSDFFYLIQFVGDEQGSLSYEDIFYTRRDEKGNILRASELNVPLERKIEFADHVEKVVRKKFDVLFGMQFGKRFDRLAFRIGMFESTFGLGADYYVPLPTDKMHWVTTIEAFDFRGKNRLPLHDMRPHVKWLNRVFFFKNMYTNFGIDDVFSKRRANPFFGGGLRFGDDDLKYLLGTLPIGKAGGA